MFDSSIIGIRNSLAIADRAAKNIANWESSDPQDQVDMMIAERSLEANVNALKVSMRMSEQAIDLLA